MTKNDSRGKEKLIFYHFFHHYIQFGDEDHIISKENEKDDEGIFDHIIRVMSCLQIPEGITCERRIKFVYFAA